MDVARVHLRLKGALCARNYVVSLGDIRYKVAEVEKEKETQEHIFQCVQLLVVIQNTTAPEGKNTENWIVGKLWGNTLQCDMGDVSHFGITEETVIMPIY